MTSDVVIDIACMFSTEAHVLINTGAMHSFIFCEFATHVDVAPVLLDYHIEICISTGESLWPTQVLK